VRKREAIIRALKVLRATAEDDDDGEQLEPLREVARGQYERQRGW